MAIRQSEVGVQLGVTAVDSQSAAIDISGAQTLTMRFERPDGSRITKTASLTGDGTDGKLHFATTADFPDTPGWWSRQGEVVWANGTKYITGRVDFKVERPI